MHTPTKRSQSKAAENRHPGNPSSRRAKADGWWGLAQLVVSPFSLARAARKASALQATVAMVVMLTLGIMLPLATTGAATNEPFRDLTWYADEIMSWIPRSVLWTSPLLAFLLFMLAFPARLAEKNGRIRLASELRVIMLAPFALIIPASVWCVMYAGGLTNKPGFNLYWYEQNGITPVSRNAFVVFLGNGQWWLAGPVAAALLAFHAIRSFKGMPRLDGLPYCDECFYSLVGNKSGICPECGLAIDTVGNAGMGQDQGVVSAVTTNSAVAETGCE